MTRLQQEQTGTEFNSVPTRTVRTMCPMNCHPTFCGMEVTVAGERLVEIRGDKDNPDSRGFLCVRGQAAYDARVEVTAS